MISFLAILKHTVKSALRSYVFQILNFLLIVSVIAIPMTISGDGTAYGFIQISLKYSLGFASFILSLSAVWLSCQVMTQDVESYQIHMVLSKPVSRVKVWIGKLCGVFLINFALLLIASAVILLLVMFQFKTREFPKEERDKINNEVLVGRTVFYPQIPDINEKTKEEFLKRLSESNVSGMQNSTVPQTAEGKTALYQEIRRQIIANLGEVKFGPQEAKTWTFNNVPKIKDAPVFIRYRIYHGSITSKEQKETYGVWFARFMLEEKPAEGAPKDAKPQVREVFLAKSQEAERIVCSAFHEFAMTPDVIGEDNTVALRFMNLDMNQKPLFFQLADGPKLLIKSTSFINNYLRAVAVIALKILILCGLSCAFASALSMPTAIFMVCAYLLFGSFSSFLIGNQEMYGEDPKASIMEKVGLSVSHVLMTCIIPVQKFEISDKVSNGELIEFRYMRGIFIEYMLIKGMPWFLLGIWLYRRRELGLVIRK